MTTHIFKTGQTSMEVHLTETPAAVRMHITRQGPALPLEQLPTFAAWLWPILAPFDRDRRPLVMRNGNTNEEALLLTP